MNKLFELIAKIFTFFLFSKFERKRKRWKIIRDLKTKYYGRQVLKNAKSIGIGFGCGGYSCVNKYTTIGDYSHFNGMFINGGGNVHIGSYFHSGSECMIIARNHDYDNGTHIPYGMEYIEKDVIIDDFVWFGRRVTVLPGTHIGEGAIIQAGAVVHGEIPPYAIAGGNPAKVFKYRDIEHFKKLKEEKKFLTNDVYFYHSLDKNYYKTNSEDKSETLDRVGGE